MKILTFVVGLITAPIGSLYFILGAFGDSPKHMALGLIAMTISAYSMNYTFNKEKHNV